MLRVRKFDGLLDGSFGHRIALAEVANADCSPASREARSTLNAHLHAIFGPALSYLTIETKPDQLPAFELCSESIGTACILGAAWIVV